MTIPRSSQVVHPRTPKPPGVDPMWSGREASLGRPDAKKVAVAGAWPGEPTPTSRFCGVTSPAWSHLPPQHLEPSVILAWIAVVCLRRERTCLDKGHDWRRGGARRMSRPGDYGRTTRAWGVGRLRSTGSRLMLSGKNWVIMGHARKSHTATPTQPPIASCARGASN